MTSCSYLPSMYDTAYLYERYDLGIALAVEQGLSLRSEQYAFAMAFAGELEGWPLDEAVECCAILRETMELI